MERSAKEAKKEKKAIQDPTLNETKNSVVQSEPSPAKEEPSFEQFRAEMLRHLAPVPRPKVDALLKSLYLAVERKRELEIDSLVDRENVQMFRPSRLRMNRAAKLLMKAQQMIRRAKTQFPEQLHEIEEKAEGEEYEFTFDEVIQSLTDALEIAGNCQLADVGQIHPDMRTKKEGILARKKIGGGPVAGEIVGHDHPVSERSPEIDHWFIAEAASCLDKYPKSGGGKIPGYPHIIAQLFRVAFNDESRTEESIRKELQHQ